MNSGHCKKEDKATTSNDVWTEPRFMVSSSRTAFHHEPWPPCLVTTNVWRWNDRQSTPATINRTMKAYDDWAYSPLIHITLSGGLGLDPFVDTRGQLFKVIHDPSRHLHSHSPFSKKVRKHWNGLTTFRVTTPSVDALWSQIGSNWMCLVPDVVWLTHWLSLSYSSLRHIHTFIHVSKTNKETTGSIV